MSSGPPSRLESLIAMIGPLDGAAIAEAARRLDRLTKPPGSLRWLEDLAITLAGISGHPAPDLDRRAIVVFAADHGIARRGVSRYPIEVTAQMVANFLAGGAAINALAGIAGAEVVVVDVGVASPIPGRGGARSEGARFISSVVRRGSRDLSTDGAPTLDETRAAMMVGADLAAGLSDEGIAIAGAGEMGIGNTAAASAIVAALTGRPVGAVTGRGTGADDATFERKVRVIEDALAMRRPDPPIRSACSRPSGASRSPRWPGSSWGRRRPACPSSWMASGPAQRPSSPRGSVPRCPLA